MHYPPAPRLGLDSIPRWCQCYALDRCVHSYCTHCGEHTTRNEHTEYDPHRTDRYYGPVDDRCQRLSIRDRWDALSPTQRDNTIWLNNPNAPVARTTLAHNWGALDRIARASIVHAWATQSTIDARRHQ